MWPRFVIVVTDYELTGFIVKCCMLLLFTYSIALITNFLFNLYIFDRVALSVTVFSVSFYVIHNESISLSLRKLVARPFARLSRSFISCYFVISISSLGPFMLNPIRVFFFFGGEGAFFWFCFVLLVVVLLGKELGSIHAEQPF